MFIDNFPDGLTSRWGNYGQVANDTEKIQDESETARPTNRAKGTRHFLTPVMRNFTGVIYRLTVP
jgi:hypothetical protein